MTVIASTGQLHRVVPADRAGRPEGERVAYLLRTPSVYDRARLKKAARAQGARHVSRAELAAELKAGLGAIVEAGAAPADADVEELVALVDAFEPECERLTREIEELRGGAGELVEAACAEAGRSAPEPPEETRREVQARLEEIGGMTRRLSAAQDIVADHVPRFRQLAAEADFWEEILVIEAARLLVAGAEGIDLGPIGEAGLTRAQLERVPEAHRQEIGARARAVRPGRPGKKRLELAVVWAERHDKRWRVRTEADGTARLMAWCAGVALPPRVRPSIRRPPRSEHKPSPTSARA